MRSCCMSPLGAGILRCTLERLVVQIYNLSCKWQECSTIAGAGKPSLRQAGIVGKDRHAAIWKDGDSQGVVYKLK